MSRLHRLNLQYRRNFVGAALAAAASGVRGSWCAPDDAMTATAILLKQKKDREEKRKEEEK